MKIIETAKFVELDVKLKDMVDSGVISLEALEEFLDKHPLSSREEVPPAPPYGIYGWARLGGY